MREREGRRWGGTGEGNENGDMVSKRELRGRSGHGARPREAPVSYRVIARAPFFFYSALPCLALSDR
jgi:hypothetical protein